ncbi:MAG TPA: hypothetical protein VJ246_02110 [Patescibacteria group bacterium]|nr:hypothetical protein [Patescibacteria group bacterium]
MSIESRPQYIGEEQLQKLSEAQIENHIAQFILWTDGIVFQEMKFQDQIDELQRFLTTLNVYQDRFQSEKAEAHIRIIEGRIAELQKGIAYHSIDLIGSTYPEVDSGENLDAAN